MLIDLVMQTIFNGTYTNSHGDNILPGRKSTSQQSDTFLNLVGFFIKNIIYHISIDTPINFKWEKWNSLFFIFFIFVMLLEFVF